MMRAAKQKHTAMTTVLLAAAVFAGMLILNAWTPYAADDFNYLLHFGTKERLRTLGDVAESMYVHSLHMNGRVVSHTIAQLFALAPKWVFNLCNAAVFTGLVYLMHRAANFGRRDDPLLFVMTAMGMFCAMPVFGQVCLWFVGSANYMWALFFGMLYLAPFLARYLDRPDIVTGWRFGLYCAGCVLFGMYSEITSFVYMYLAAALMLLAAVLKKKPLKSTLWFGWLFSCIGYLILLAIPAERSAKQAGGLDLELLVSNFARATETILAHCAPLLILFAALFALGVMKRIDHDRLILAALLLTGALGGNYMTMAAAYYPARCLATTAMLLILAIAMLLAPWMKTVGVKAAGAALAAVFLWQAWFGVSDIYRCNQDFLAREAVIVAAAEAGETRVTAQIVVPQTPYSAFWELRDLSTEDPATWPNFAMGKLYGIEILGAYPE